MLNKTIITNGKKISLVAIILFTLFSISANAADNAALKDISAQQYSKAIRNLKQKLATDLATDKIDLQVNSISEAQIARNQIKLAGDGLCVLTADNNQLPISFAVVVNNTNNQIVDVSYDFKEAAVESLYAPSSTEEILMQQIMNQIHQDYQTNNIVINIDSFQNVNSTNNKKTFTGEGEVRIGDMIWQKINFKLTLNEQQKAETVDYQVK